MVPDNAVPPESSPAYKGHERWAMRRWAWAFLRRNTDFIKKCNQLGANPTKEELSRLAEDFKLKRFKRQTEDYRVGKKPRFLSSDVSLWANVTSTGPAPLRLKISLEPGQVLVRFDLNPALEVGQSLEKQLLRAKQRLNSQFRNYVKTVGKPATDRKLKVDLLKSIRMLDAKALGIPRAEIARAIYPQQTRGMDNSECREFLKARLEIAEEYARTRYVHLAARTVTVRPRPS